MSNIFTLATKFILIEITIFLELFRTIQINPYFGVIFSIIINTILLDHANASGVYTFNYEDDRASITVLGFVLTYIEGWLGVLLIILPAIGAMLSILLRYKKIALCLLILAIGMFILRYWCLSYYGSEIY